MEDGICQLIGTFASLVGETLGLGLLGSAVLNKYSKIGGTDHSRSPVITRGRAVVFMHVAVAEPLATTDGQAIKFIDTTGAEPLAATTCGRLINNLWVTD